MDGTSKRQRDMVDKEKKLLASECNDADSSAEKARNAAAARERRLKMWTIVPIRLIYQNFAWPDRTIFIYCACWRRLSPYF